MTLNPSPGESDVRVEGVKIKLNYRTSGASQVAQMVKNLPEMWDTWIRSLVHTDVEAYARIGARASFCKIKATSESVLISSDLE